MTGVQTCALPISLAEVAAAVRAPVAEVPARVAQLQTQVKDLGRELDRVKASAASSQGQNLAAQATVLPCGAHLLVTRVDGMDAKALRATVDQLKDQLKSLVVVLASVEGNDKIQLVAGVTSEIGRLKREVQGNKVKISDNFVKLARNTDYSDS